jgi:hypothetical protein
MKKWVAENQRLSFSFNILFLFVIIEFPLLPIPPFKFKLEEKQNNIKIKKWVSDFQRPTFLFFIFNSSFQNPLCGAVPPQNTAGIGLLSKY